MSTSTPAQPVEDAAADLLEAALAEAHAAGVVRRLSVAPGAPVTSCQVLCVVEAGE